ncbi:MAG TPA: endonuclease/exonuclease/phosphatase family protein [Cytophagaceae bacterium]|nr:endonuclease/exonuclease/phosphatase family protein [Cytophagaceae bacterium]
MKIGFTLISNLVTVVLTLLLYYVPDIKPEDFPIGVFLIFLVPFFIVFNLIFVVIWLFKKPRYWALLSLLVVLTGYKFLDRSLAIGKPRSDKKDFTVLNCNVRIFNVYDHLRDKNSRSSKEMLQWVKNFDADIICLQEFFLSETDPVFFTEKEINKKFPYSYFNPFLEYKKQKFGMAIFSKYPIVSRGEIKFRNKSNNQIVYADIRIKKQIVRVYNIHLQSMSIDENDIVNSKFDNASRNKWVNILLRYKNGSIQRGRQVDELVKHIEACPYKVMVCGDLNEPPYGYAYEELSDLLDNAFQKAGNGFGVTYNGKLPLLRIDNQFFGKGLKTTRFNVHKEMTYSDHYPISADYVFE